MNHLILALFDALNLLSTRWANRFVNALCRCVPAIGAPDFEVSRAQLAAALPGDAAAARRVAYEVIREVAAVSVLAAKHWDDTVAHEVGNRAEDEYGWAVPTEAELAVVCSSDDAWWSAVVLATRHACAGAKVYASVSRDDCRRDPRRCAGLLWSLLAGDKSARDRDVLGAIARREPGHQHWAAEVPEAEASALRAGTLRAVLVPLACGWIEPGDQFTPLLSGEAVTGPSVVGDVRHHRFGSHTMTLVSLEALRLPAAEPRRSLVPTEELRRAVLGLSVTWRMVDLGDPVRLLDEMSRAVERAEAAVRAAEPTGEGGVLRLLEEAEERHGDLRDLVSLHVGDAAAEDALEKGLDALGDALGALRERVAS